MPLKIPQRIITLDRQNTVQTITGTAAVQTVYSFSIPANTFRSDSIFLLKWWNNLNINGPGTRSLELRVNGTSLVDYGPGLEPVEYQAALTSATELTFSHDYWNGLIIGTAVFDITADNALTIVYTPDNTGDEFIMYPVFLIALL